MTALVGTGSMVLRKHRRDLHHKSRRPPRELQRRYQEAYRLFLTSGRSLPLHACCPDPNGYSNELQGAIADNLRPHVSWMTAIGVIDAVESMIQEAIDNGNIDQDGVIK